MCNNTKIKGGKSISLFEIIECVEFDIRKTNIYYQINWLF